MLTNYFGGGSRKGKNKYTHQGMSIFSPKISKVEGLVGECLLFVRLCVNSIKVATFPSALENQ